MSRLNFGRLMFFAGTMLALPYWLYGVMFSDTQTARYPLILIAGVVIALAGIIVLLFSRKEAVAEYKALERQEALRQKRRAEAEAKRMKVGGWGDWEEFTQIRRLREGMIEFRNGTPFCMVAALGLFLAALDMAFWGMLLPSLGLPAGILTAAAGVGVFPIVEIAEGEFPDNTGLEWTIHGFERKGDLTYVEVEPVPPEVGYPRFKLVVASGKSGGVEVVATYCLEMGFYSLLSSASGYRRQLPKRLV